MFVCQGERDELREGVGRIQDELLSLRKSNSLLARRKQQWSVLLCLICDMYVIM